MVSVFESSSNYQPTCTICKSALRFGSSSNPTFSTRCSHSFHYNCITRHVKLGNNKCPVPCCGAELSDIPSHGSASIPTSQDPCSESPFTTSQNTSSVNHPFSTISQIPSFIAPSTASQNPSPFNPFTFSVSPFSTSQSPWTRTSSLFRPSNRSQTISSEPLVFNDDDPLVLESNISSNNTSTIRYVDISTHTEFPAVSRATSKENFHVLVNLKSRVTDTDQGNTDSITSRAPIDLVTVLDVSGSMAGTKIQLVQRAMRFVIDNLGPSDRLSVISFSYDASRLFPLLLMNESGKQRAIQAVDSLVANGGTNITDGLKKGTKVIEDRGHKNPVCSIMLLSDGQDSREKTINFKEISKVQIPVHTFGFGSDHSPVMLHSIAESSKGSFSFIEAEGYIQDAFAQRIGGLLSVAVQDLEVHIQSLDPNLCLGQLKAGSYSTNLTDNNRTGYVNIGDMYADEQRDFLALVNIPAVADGNVNDPMKLVSVWCSYKNPFTKESVTTEAVEVKLPRPETVNNEDMVASIEVDRQKNRLQAAEAMKNSRAAAESGDLPGARSIIDDFRKQMLETPSMHSGDKFTANLDLELQEMKSRMVDKEAFFSTGRGFALQAMSSHSRQQATTRTPTMFGSCAGGPMFASAGGAPLSGSAFGSCGGAPMFGAAPAQSCFGAYQTPAMDKMVNLSRASQQNSSAPADNTHQTV